MHKSGIAGHLCSAASIPLPAVGPASDLAKRPPLSSTDYRRFIPRFWAMATKWEQRVRSSKDGSSPCERFWRETGLSLRSGHTGPVSDWRGRLTHFGPLKPARGSSAVSDCACLERTLLDSNTNREAPKSEIRNPKSEKPPPLALIEPRPAGSQAQARGWSRFAFRVSDFGLLSAFGFRTSAFFRPSDFGLRVSGPWLPEMVVQNAPAWNVQRNSRLEAGVLRVKLACSLTKGLRPGRPGETIKEAMKRTELIKRYRVAENKKFRLSDINPADTWKLKSKDHAQEWLEKGVARLSGTTGQALCPEPVGACC